MAIGGIQDHPHFFEKEHRSSHAKMASPMKNNPTLPPIRHEPSDKDIREYAYHLYQQSSCVPGHDLDNWLEATACLKANIPSHCSHSRLHRHLNGPKDGELSLLSIEEAKILIS
jgi:hypothetical protein